MPPRVRLHQIKNYTDEHIDGKGIADKIRIKLMQSGKVRFLADSENLDQVFDERDLTESTTVKAGNSAMAASDYILTGSVRSIRKRSDKLADVFYQPPADSPPLSGIDESVLRAGIKGIFPLHKLRVQNYVSLLTF